MATLQQKREFDFSLPIGVIDGEGRVCRDGALRKMTGREEAILADPQNQRNGGKLVTELLHSCLVRLDGMERLTRESVGGMYSADRNYLLLKLRIATFGPDLRASYTCPACTHLMQVTEDLETLPIKTLENGESVEDIRVELEDGYLDKNGEVHTALRLRLPTGTDEAAVAPQMHKNASLGKNALLARCLKALGDMQQQRINALGPRIMADLTMSDRRLIDRALNSAAPGVDLIREIECPACGHEFKASLDMTHFLSME